MGKKVWAIIVEEDFVGYATGDSPEEAIARWREENRVSPSDTPDELVRVVDAEAIREDVQVPGRLVSGAEYGPELAGIEPDDPEWDELKAVMDLLGDDLDRVVDWVRVDSVLDLWVPIVERA